MKGKEGLNRVYPLEAGKGMAVNCRCLAVPGARSYTEEIQEKRTVIAGEKWGETLRKGISRKGRE